MIFSPVKYFTCKISRILIFVARFRIQIGIDKKKSYMYTYVCYYTIYLIFVGKGRWQKNFLTTKISQSTAHAFTA